MLSLIQQLPSIDDNGLFFMYFIIETEGRNYPAYVSTSSNYSFSQAIASKAPGVQSYSVTIAASEDEANLEKTSEDKVSTFQISFVDILIISTKSL